MSFSVTKKDGFARIGVLKTRFSDVQTPFFMPVATFASGRGIGPFDYEGVGVQACISNAFLLSLKPSCAVVKALGGLHEFTNFKKCFFTDSGGFQSSSKNMFLQTSRNGIHLKSPYDGGRKIITPKVLVEMQLALASDVAMVIDDMAPPDATVEQFNNALEKTHRWAKECKSFHDKSKSTSLNPQQMLFAIVQGGYDAGLRKQSAEYLSSLDFDGYGIGGCAIGEPKPDMYRAIKNAVPHLPKDKPRYLMGVGSPEDIVLAVSWGVDCFDSIFPTRNARHDMIFTFHGSYHVDKASFTTDKRPLEEGCDCWVCHKHTRAYIRHLASIDEAEGMRLRQVHNLRFMMRLMDRLRKNINQGTLAEFREAFLHDWFKGKIPKIYRELLDELNN